ncbi:MAG: hypothetical protein QNJ69_00175 [Gammaproteobacteria bacterium]|nr:hypothetical protein [Gammaproteobacteria bacterium]
MRKIYPTLKILGLAFLAMPLGVTADSWSCRHDNDVREIQIVRHSDGPVPCDVVYKKLTEGVEDQVLWSAVNDPNYCDYQAQAFVDKQTGWGWTCVETLVSTPTE